MSNNIILILVLVSLGLSSYAVFSDSDRREPVVVEPQAVVSSGVSQGPKERFLERQKNTFELRGVISAKTDAGLEIDGVLLDPSKILKASEENFPAEDQLTKNVKMNVTISKDTYFPFKSLAELGMGEKVVVVSAKPVMEGHSILATHIYNDIPGL